MSELTIGSLCSGYEGLGMAVQQVFGGRLAWVADPDPGAAAILAHHWPTVPNLGDITTADWDQVEPVDMLLAGYPCQPFSDAGQRKGTADERHIWPHIATAIRILRPGRVVLENVRGHLGRGFDTVLADLAALGLDAEWATVRASEVGAPHRRERLFVYATAQDPDSPTRRQRRLPAPREETSRRTRADAGRRGGAPAADTGGRRLAGDAELPHERDAIQRRLRGDADGRGHETASDAAGIGHGDARASRFGGLPAAAVGGGAAAPADGGVPNWGVYGPAIARWEGATGRAAPWAVDDRGRLSPVFVEWLMGLPAGHVTAVPDLSRTQMLHALGNGVVPQQAAAAIRLLHARTTTPAAPTA